MKAKSFYLMLLLGSLTMWSCSNKSDLSQGSLKSSLNNSVQELTTAMSTISQSSGYQVLSVSNTSAGSPSLVKAAAPAIDSTYNSILLSDIAGVYDYKPNYFKRGSSSILRYFVKTADSSLMVVRLPEEKVKNPRLLTHYSPSDTLLTNNYIVTLSDYQYKFKNYFNWDYQMASNINIKGVNAGDLNIQSSNSTGNGYKFASAFKFTDNYTASCKYTTGDTAVATYTINDGTKTLYEEKYTAIRTSMMGMGMEKRHKEKEYSLTIGDVQIVRTLGHENSSLDSAKVYVAGVLQLHSKVEFVTDSTSDDTENCIMNHKRDLKVTFDDGTSTTISTLLGTSIDTIRGLFASLRQATFSTAIIDWIAWDIYDSKQ